MPIAPRKIGLVIVVCALLSFALKIVLAVNTYGTNDVIFWEGNLAKIRSDGGLALYRDGVQIIRNGALYHTEPFNQPPFMIHLLRIWGWVADLTGLPLRFWLRATGALADLGSLALVWRILVRSQGLKPTLPGLLLVALSPVSIMVSGFHGNTDPIMIFFVLLSVDCIESGRPAWLAGAALGMAMNIKIVPVLFVPAAILFLPSMRRRIEFAVGLGAVALAAWLPLVAQDPLIAINRVFGYRGTLGHWGFSRFIRIAAAVLNLGDELNAGYLLVAKWTALTAVLAAAAWMNGRPQKPPLFLQFGWIAFLFLLFSPAFGAQYLAWLVPWIAALEGWAVLFYWSASGLFLFEVYTYWSRGFPWYLADMINTQDLGNGLLYFVLETLCWAAVVCVAWTYWKHMSRFG
jgi:hypothetical protein